MRIGATRREAIKVILQSAVNFGMLTMLHSLKIFVKLVAEQGRLAEVGNPPQRDETS